MAVCGDVTITSAFLLALMTFLPARARLTRLTKSATDVKSYHSYRVTAPPPPPLLVFVLFCFSFKKLEHFPSPMTFVCVSPIKSRLVLLRILFTCLFSVSQVGIGHVSEYHQDSPIAWNKV